MPPADGSLSEFALKFHAPESIFEPGVPVQMTCTIKGDHAGTLTREKPETLEFRGRFPKLPAGTPIGIDFKVESGYSPGGGDLRDLGIVVPLLDKSRVDTVRIPFRVS